MPRRSDHQAVGLGPLGRADGHLGGVLALGHQPHGLGGVDRRHRPGAGQRLEEQRALLERQRVRQHPLDRLQRHVGHPAQAEVDLDGLLADDVQVLLPQHVVDLVDAAGGGALDVQQRQVDRPRLQRGHRFLDRRAAEELGLLADLRDELLAGQVVEGVGRADVGHPQHLRLGRQAGQRAGLAGDRVGQDLREDPARQRRRHPGPPGQRLDPGQDLVLAPGVADAARLSLLLPDHPGHGLHAPGDQADQVLVDLVQRLAQLAQGRGGVGGPTWAVPAGGGATGAAPEAGESGGLPPRSFVMETASLPRDVDRPRPAIHRSWATPGRRTHPARARRGHRHTRGHASAVPGRQAGLITASRRWWRGRASRPGGSSPARAGSRPIASGGPGPGPPGRPPDRPGSPGRRSTPRGGRGWGGIRSWSG